jgi:phosphoribosylformylglycinamidine cyclo-ligase
MPNRAKAYAEAGVNLDAANSLIPRIKSIVSGTHTKGVLSDIGGFGGLFRPDLGDMKEPVLVASTDGVGTKIKLAASFNKHQGIGVDLVAMSANDILVQGAKPLFFLDYFATGKLEPATVEAVIASVAEGCKQAGCALLGGETAEMPGMYADGEYDLAGFCVGIVDNDKVVEGSGVSVGDVIIGLASSGLHSNGYSLVRKIVDKAGLGPDEVFPSPSSSSKTKKKLTWEVLLEPTSIYVKPVLNLLRDYEIKAMVHITGGGFYDNIPRVLPKGVEARIDFGSWRMPDVFTWLKETGQLSWPEMLQVFNCGIGYILIVDEAVGAEIINRLKRAFKLPAWKIGEIHRHERSAEERVNINFI